MNEPHRPNLDAIQVLANKEIQFYAVAGVVVSLAGTLEATLFDIFHKGSGLDRDLALEIFFKVKIAPYRREMADAAMQHRVKSDAAKLKAWDDLDARLGTIMNKDGPRNLIAHNFVTRRLWGEGWVVRVGEHRLYGPPFPSGALPEPGLAMEEFHVTQDANIAALKGKPVRKEDFDSLMAYARELLSLITDLEAFFGSL